MGTVCSPDLAGAFAAGASLGLDPGFVGTDSFTYHDSDGNNTSNTIQAAAAAVSGAMMAERSARPLALMPARTAPQRNPRGKEEVGSMKLLL